MTRLPGSVGELRGLRAARWIRESTAGQFDRYGPDAQRELQTRSIERLGLVDTGLEYSAAHSGSTVHGSPMMRSMLDAAAAGAFDVLVVAYVARWQRNLRQTLNLLEEDLHPAGVAVWFADEELLSSSDRAWDQLVDEAKGAESWLRKHRRRVKEGLAAKLREQRDPGGHPPYGFRRDVETKLMEPDPDHLPTVRRVFELAAARLTDREVAAQTGLTLHVVRGMLRSTIYAGRLPDGRETRFAAVIPPALWNDVQAVRETRRTRDGRPPKRRHYALSMLRCSSCGRRLIGDTGRYRHTDPCQAFVAAAIAPKRRRRGEHADVLGRSYAAAAYEHLVTAVLERVALGADVITAAIADTQSSGPDRVGLARVERERDQALDRYRRTRDAGELERAMARLDTEAELASTVDVDALPADEAVAYLRDLPKLWADAPESRRAIAESLFASIEVLGLRSMRVTPTAAAVDRGLADAFHARTHVYGRGERSGGRGNPLMVRAVPGIATRITIVLPPRRLVPVAARGA